MLPPRVKENPIKQHDAEKRWVLRNTVHGVLRDILHPL